MTDESMKAAVLHRDESVVYEIATEYDVITVRNAAAVLAEACGFTRTHVYQIVVSVSELATNLVFHASHGGRITLTVLHGRQAIGLQVIAEDVGPGIADIDLAMTDGYSTAGTLGGGLSGVRRLMTEFEIASQPGGGTSVLARKWTSCK